jgi:hypothetical protein
VATVTHLVGTADTGNTPNTSGAFAPTSGELLVVFVVATATLTNPAALTSSIGGFTFSQSGYTLRANNNQAIYCFVADALVSDTSSQTVTFNPADTASGTVFFVTSVSGMSRTGTDAVLQTASASGEAATTPEAVFSSSALTGNPTYAVVGNNSNGSGFTEPTGWTEDGTSGDLGFDFPPTRAEYAYRNSGFTGTTITWGVLRDGLGSADGRAGFFCDLLRLWHAFAPAAYRSRRRRV